MFICNYKTVKGILVGFKYIFLIIELYVSCPHFSISLQLQNRPRSFALQNPHLPLSVTHTCSRTIRRSSVWVGAVSEHRPCHLLLLSFFLSQCTLPAAYSILVFLSNRYTHSQKWSERSQRRRL